MKATVSLLAIAAFAVSASLLPAEEGYIIPVDRPSKAGEKVKMAIEGETVSKMKFIAGGEVVQDENKAWKASMEVTQTIDKVDKKGDATELTLEIHKSSLEMDGKTGELLPAGTIVKALAKDEGNDEFTVNGEPVEESTRDVLDSLVDLSMGNTMKGDENKAFGVDQPRKPGDEWDLNVPELLATLPPEMPFILDPAATKGKMKFVELSGEGDNKTALLQGQIELAMKGMQGLPPNATFAGSSLTVALDGLFPLDKDKAATREGLSMLINLKGHIPMPDGTGADMTGNVTVTRKTRVLP